MASESKKTVMGETLARLRKAHNVTQEQVAQTLKIKRSTYAYYERDITPPLDIIKRLANMFNVPTHFLMYGEMEKPLSSGMLADNGIWGSTPTFLSGYDCTDINLSFAHLKPQEREFMLKFRDLPEDIRAKIEKEINDAHDKL